MFNARTNWDQALPTPKYLKNGQFLPISFTTYPRADNDKNSHHPYLEFSGTDSPELFQKNLKTQSADWHYRTKAIYYNTNSNGYRAPEWDTVDWAESVVIFGCSMVAGIGLAKDETISYQLSQILNRPVINLGAGGTSAAFSFHNNLVLDTHYATPWAVVNIWTCLDRLSIYDSSVIHHEGSWTFKKGEIFDLWNRTKYNPIIHNCLHTSATQKIWEPKTRYFSASFFEDTAYYTGSKHLAAESDARDLLHPGATTAKNTAVIIAAEL